jgi:hypothetical protein
MLHGFSSFREQNFDIHSIATSCFYTRCFFVPVAFIQLDQEDAETRREGDAERDISQDHIFWLQAPGFIRGEKRNSSLLESPGFIRGVSPRLRVPLSPCPLQCFRQHAGGFNPNLLKTTGCDRCF